MKRDARANKARAGASGSPRAGAGGTLLGIFIGLALGLALAAAVAWTLMSGRASPAAKPAENAVARNDAKVAKAPAPEKDKDRFDFYKILPGGEEPKLSGDKKGTTAAQPKSPDAKAAEAAKSADAAKPDRPADKVAAAEPSAPKAAKRGERYWLQAGSFSQEADAENLRARLALAGWEAQVSEGVLPDKAVRYRVRLGPYDNADEIGRVKGELSKRGFDAAVIKY